MPSTSASTLASSPTSFSSTTAPRAGGAERPGPRPVPQHPADGVDGLLPGVADDHALPGGQPVRLDDQRLLAAVLDPLLGGAGGGEDLERRRRDAGPFHQALGVRLAALQFRRRGAGAERGDAGLPQPVRQAGDQRDLRPDHHQVRLLPLRQFHETRHVVGFDERVHDVRLALRAGVAGGADDAAHPRAAGQLPAQRVLPPAVADHQHRVAARTHLVRRPVGVSLGTGGESSPRDRVGKRAAAPNFPPRTLSAGRSEASIAPESPAPLPARARPETR